MTVNGFNYFNSGGFKLCTEITYSAQNVAEDDLHLKSDNQSQNWPKLCACLASLCLFHNVEGTDWTTVGRKRCRELASLQSSRAISQGWSWREKGARHFPAGLESLLQQLTVLLFGEWSVGRAHVVSNEEERACISFSQVHCPNELSYLFHCSE